jgi:hypothetical protein
VISNGVLSSSVVNGSSVLANIAHETETFARECADQLLVFAVVANRQAKSMDSPSQRGVGNSAAGPDSSDQIVLADHAMAIVEQVVEQIEHPGLDSDDNIATAELAPRQIELTVSERVLHVVTRPSTWSNQRNAKK